MKKHLLSLFLLSALLFFVPTVHAQFHVEKDDIVILFENDVHGAIEGYPFLAEMQDLFKQQSPHIVTISCGDFLSGTSLGSYSQGGYIVRIMNAVGYDFYTVGNHEFDYGIPKLKQRVSQLQAQPLCCNFSEIGSGANLFPSYDLRTFGDKRVAFIGITTPHVPTTSTPAYFQDTAGRWLYFFHASHLDSLLQASVNEVRALGADYVVLIAHVGEIDLPHLVSQTTGIDLVLDGHSHSVLPHTLLHNRNSLPVLWTSTGTKFQHIGQAVISSRGAIYSDLIRVKELTSRNAAVADTLQAILRDYAAVGGRRVGTSTGELTRNSTSQKFLDSPLGNLCADACRQLTGAQVGLINRGGIRADLHSGDLTFDNLYSVLPFDNQTVLVEVSGQCLLDALEMGARRWPKLDGGFLQVSGITYEVDPSVPTSVVLDGNGIFRQVAGPRRVRNVKVWNAKTNRYEPLRPHRRYTLGGCEYFLLHHGDGHNFYDATVLQPAMGIDVQVLEKFLTENLQGTIGSQYLKSQGRIAVHR